MSNNKGGAKAESKQVKPQCDKTLEERKEEAVDKLFATCVGDRCDGMCEHFALGGADLKCATCGDSLHEHRYCRFKEGTSAGLYLFSRMSRTHLTCS